MPLLSIWLIKFKSMADVQGYSFVSESKLKKYCMSWFWTKSKAPTLNQSKVCTCSVSFIHCLFLPTLLQLPFTQIGHYWLVFSDAIRNDVYWHCDKLTQLKQNIAQLAYYRLVCDDVFKDRNTIGTLWHIWHTFELWFEDIPTQSRQPRIFWPKIGCLKIFFSKINMFYLIYIHSAVTRDNW